MVVFFFWHAQFFPNTVVCDLSFYDQMCFALAQYRSAVVLKPDVSLVGKLSVKFNPSCYFFFQKFCNYFTAMFVGQCWFLEKASWLKVFVTSARSLTDMFSCLSGCVSYLFRAGNLGHIIFNIQANVLVFGSNNSIEISLFKTNGLQPFEQLLLLGEWPKTPN